jgi:Flp pilus assembly protein TadG
MKLSFTARRRSSLPRRRGAAAVEAALVLPVVIMFLFGILEYGRYLMMMQIVTNAAREGARYAVEHTSAVVINGVTYGNADADVTTAVTNAMGGQSLASQSIQFYTSDTQGASNLGAWTGTSAGESICVQITGNYPVLMSRILMMNTTIPVNVKAVMRSESN